MRRTELVRLWLSYQRYGLLLTIGGVTLVVAVLARWPGSYWLWAVAGALAAWPVGFGIQVLMRWPKKLRATIVADHRIRAGRFRSGSVRACCADPCFRVVANEILRRAGEPRQVRRRIIAGLRAEAERARDLVVLIDRVRGVVITVDGGRRTEQPLGPPSTDVGPATAH